MKNLFLAVLILIFLHDAQCQDKNNVLVHYEEYPQLIGGYDSLIEANKSNLWLPKGCFEAGKSFVQFVIQKDGKITDAKTIKGLNQCPKADSIAVEIVKTVKYIPAKYKNEVVVSQRVLPIPFYKIE
jgi:hypothetical protein